MKTLWHTIFQPATVQDALALKARYGESARFLAGGTDVIVELSRGVRPTETIIDLSRIEELRGVVVDDGSINIRALATHNDVLSSEACVRDALPLAQACLEIGAPQLRTRATIAGNIATASPANDTISALIALNANVTLERMQGTRTIPIEQFFTGFRRTALEPDELIREIAIPRPGSHQRGLFMKLGLRRAQAISVVHIALVVSFDHDRVTGARIAMGCVAPVVIRAPETEGFLAGKQLTAETCRRAGEIAASEAKPIDDVRGSGAYRSGVLANMVSHALQRLANGEERTGWPERPVLLDSGEKSTPASAEDDGFWATINGEPREFSRESRTTTLLNALRDDLELTGAKEGCAEGECGACTVWIDGQAVMSCLVPAVQAHGCEVTTIEGLAATSGQAMHPVQQAFVDRAAVQCGYCIPGMIMAGAKLLDERPEPTRAETLAALSGNLCRCTGYTKIIDAMQQAVRHDD